MFQDLNFNNKQQQQNVQFHGQQYQNQQVNNSQWGISQGNEGKGYGQQFNNQMGNQDFRQGQNFSFGYQMNKNNFSQQIGKLEENQQKGEQIRYGDTVNYQNSKSISQGEKLTDNKNYSLGQDMKGVQLNLLNFDGWGQERPMVNQLGKTLFVRQIGQKNAQIKNQKGDGGEGEGKKLQGFPLIFGGLVNRQEENGWQNVSIMNIVREAIFSINPIFKQNVKRHKFPSPFIKYKIIAQVDERKVLDVCGVDDKKKGYKRNNLIIWDFHAGPNQLWNIIEQRNGEYYLINISRGFVVTIPNNLSDSEMAISVNPKIGCKNELWRLQDCLDGCFEIVSVVSGKVLDLFHEQEKNGTPVIQWNRTSKKNQKWRIVPA